MSEPERVLAGIKAFACDVDGCLTDGTLYYGEDGVELKGFSVLDGIGFRIARQAGLRYAWISGRRSALVERRATELDVDALYQRTTDKAWALQDFAGRFGLQLAEIAYLGDDLNDLPALRAAGVPMTVPAAPPEVVAVARYTTTRLPGGGAARDCLEAILRAQGTWEQAAADYLAGLQERQARPEQ